MPARNAVRKLMASPNFALCHTAEGSAYVMGEVEPYAQFWLSERERMLFALCGRKGGVRQDTVIATMLALRPGARSDAERKRLVRAMDGMVAAGVLVDPAGELSRYGADMATAYLRHRPFPGAIAAEIVEMAALAPDSRVLDLASGPGTLALELARHTPHVSIMELSRGFVAAAQDEARQRGLALEAIHESCNRLPHHEGSYDLITVSQALHWLDDIAVCKGVCRTLAPGGSFVVVHSAMDLPDSHPLAWVLGNRTPLGDKAATPFEQQARAIFRRLALLFGALHAPQVERHDPLHAHVAAGGFGNAGIRFYRQSRPFDEGFARAFLSERHVAATGMTPTDFWNTVAGRCAAAAPQDLVGHMDWAVLHFSRAAGPQAASRGYSAEARAIAFP